MTQCASRPDFSIAQLARDELSLAWPLARRVGSDPGLLSWLERMAALIDRGGGVLAAMAPDGLIHGIAVYEPVEKEAAARTLQVDSLITFELSRHAPVEKALHQALIGLVRDCGCDSLAMARAGH